MSNMFKSSLKNKLYLICLLSSLLISCDSSSNFNPNPQPSNANSMQSNGGGPGLLGSVATGMASGVGAGIGMAAGHHIINGAINKWRNRPSRYLFSRRGRY